MFQYVTPGLNSQNDLTALRGKLFYRNSKSESKVPIKARRFILGRKQGGIGQPGVDGVLY
jgi:hypothetical protein